MSVSVTPLLPLDCAQRADGLSRVNPHGVWVHPRRLKDSAAWPALVALVHPYTTLVRASAQPRCGAGGGSQTASQTATDTGGSGDAATPHFPNQT